MRRNSVLEKSVVERIAKALRGRPGIVVRKRHGTVMGMGGDPDLYGTLDGRHFEIEVKRPKDPSSVVTKLQAERLKEWKAAGAVTGVARSVAEALRILGLAPETAGWGMAVWVCAGCGEYRWESEEPPARCPKCCHTRFEREPGIDEAALWAPERLPARGARKPAADEQAGDRGDDRESWS